MKYIKYAAYVLTIVGALNWGLVGLFGFNLVAQIFGDVTISETHEKLISKELPYKKYSR